MEVSLSLVVKAWVTDPSSWTVAEMEVEVHGQWHSENSKLDEGLCSYV